ncbi:hypothetical protein [Actibacterium lipolyticum]|uniref:Uncharacterized protein n=1 Tax=Actibacterium lipolyticum TaxID=1524263 RepID=A0A238KKM0_9RHOB|nr:hypothetical protein [Actibacterium lipolyticum]SMX42662.1 hypothetical protein COL8621_02040 [Actibacterium lipolyticum]
MSDITELERRINFALERISKGADLLSESRSNAIEAAQVAEAAAKESATDDSALAAVQEELAAEKAANAQLEERVIAIRDKQESQVAQLEARVAKLTARADTAEAEIERLRAINAKLREHTTALRVANTTGARDSSLINASMAAELEALRALRESDRSELDEIIDSITPLTEEGTNA